MSATITAYAYETVANKIIEAGIGGAASAIESAAQNQISQPARPSLGMLALGANGLPLWRREEDLLGI